MNERMGLIVNILDLVKENKVMLAIIIKAEENGFSIVEANNNRVIVKANCIPVTITWEMCSCHGGRMWFTNGDTGIFKELSSTKYDTENGIDSPETELAFYIDNKMIDTINGFAKYVYVVETIGRYRDGKVEIHYFNSIESASYFVFDENGHDINSEYGSITHQYPNPNIKQRVTYIGDEDGAIKFKGERIEKIKDEFKVVNEWEIKFKVFRK